MRTVTFTEAEAKRLRTMIKFWNVSVREMLNDEKRKEDWKAMQREVDLLIKVDKKLRKPKVAK